MKNMKMMATGVCPLTVVSCQAEQSTGALIDGSVGAALGGIVGQIIGCNDENIATDVAVGGAVGAGAGAPIGCHMNRVAHEAVRWLPNTRVDKATDVNDLGCVKVTFGFGILFPLNDSDLSTSTKNSLIKFTSLMQRNSNCDVAIQGYTDAPGSDNINLSLSQCRTDAVSSYLKGRGVSNRQIRSVQGFGSANSIENKTISQASRRVETYLYASSEMIRQTSSDSL